MKIYLNYHLVGFHDQLVEIFKDLFPLNTNLFKSLEQKQSFAVTSRLVNLYILNYADVFPEDNDEINIESWEMIFEIELLEENPLSAVFKILDKMPCEDLLCVSIDSPEWIQTSKIISAMESKRKNVER